MSLPIHPLRLCKEVRDFMDRDAIIVVDGHEILNFARQSIPTHVAGHRVNAGPNGCMGVAVPFGLGAKVAKPDTQVIVLSGDGSFGMNGMEIDTMVRHKIPVLVVISNNGGWAGVGEWTPAGIWGSADTIRWRRYSAATGNMWRGRRISVRRWSARLRRENPPWSTWSPTLKPDPRPSRSRIIERSRRQVRRDV